MVIEAKRTSTMPEKREGSPHNIDAEKCVLGCCLLDASARFTVLSRLKASDFHIPSHRRIFAAISNLNSRGIESDYVTLTQELLTKNELQNAGGAEYISTLTNVVPSERNASHYSDIVLELSRLRQIERIGADIQNAVRESGEPSQTILERLFGNVISLVDGHDTSAKAVTITEAFQRSDKYWQDVDSGVIPPPMKTGFTGLDRFMRFCHGDLCVIGARPSQGKTALSVQICLNILRQYPESRVLYLSTEMTAEKISHRFAANYAGQNLNRMTWGHEKFLSTAENYQGLVSAGGRIRIAELRACNEVEIATIVQTEIISKRKPTLLVVDYLQNLKWSQRTESERIKIANISRFLGQFSTQHRIATVLCSQLTRGDGRPTMQLLRESGNIEQDADIIILVHPQGEWDSIQSLDEWEMNLYVDKQRNGPTGFETVRFDRKIQRIETVRTPQ